MAKRITFLRDFIYTPSRERRVSTKYRAGMKNKLVTEECAEKAIAAGAATLQDVAQPGAPPTPAPVRRGRPVRVVRPKHLQPVAGRPAAVVNP